MPSGTEWINYIPPQWVGILALIGFVWTVMTRFIEKSETFAKLLPLGTWWHERSKRRRRQRVDLIADDNEIIRGLREQIGEVAQQQQKQDEDQRCFKAWSIYDARYHHRLEIEHAEKDCDLPRHYDYFEFERIWRQDPIKAARLSDFGGLR